MSSSSMVPSMRFRLAATSTPRAATGSSCVCTATSSRRRARSRSRSSSARGRSTTWRQPDATAFTHWRRATWRACCCPRARSSSVARCRPPARSWKRAPPSRSPRTSTPGARSARACRSSARSPVRSSGFRPPQALTACTVNAAHVLGRADSKGRLAPGFDADIVLLDAPDWRYLAYHLGGDVVSEVIVGGTALG